MFPKLGQCESSGCKEKAVAFNDDGEALCEDCLMEWATTQADGAGDFDED